MLDRRSFLQVALALGAGGTALGPVSRAMATQALKQSELLRFDALGQVTLLHFTDIHAQLKPLFFREPSVNIGVGEVARKPPHLTGTEYLRHYGIEPRSALAYALTAEDFASLAMAYGRIGGVDRLATLIYAIRAERENKTLLLDGGDTWQGSYTALATKGADMVRVMNALGVDAMTAHWEYTYGQARVEELIESLNFPLLAGNVFDNEWNEPVFDSTAYFERGGVKIAVIGQAFPYTPIANPRYKIPSWSFGVREDVVRNNVAAARAEGAELVVLLSHDGFDVDRKLAGRTDGIDVILTGHTHDALPAVVEINKTLLIASGSHGKFLSRLDLEVKKGRVTDYRFRLIPVFSDVIAPDPGMQALVEEIREPYRGKIEEVLGETESLLYRRGNLNGTFDDLILAAIRETRDAEIALSPGFRWGASLVPGQNITVDDVYNQTAITYPEVYRTTMTGTRLKEVLEDVADNLFNPDPYYQQGGDMVRIAGVGYRLRASAPAGQRIERLSKMPGGEPIDASREYVVTGWASVNEDVEGPAVYDIVSEHIKSLGKAVRIAPNDAVQIV